MTLAGAFPLVGRVVCSMWDDAPVPLLGVVVEQLDDEHVLVAWGCRALAEVPPGKFTTREPLDELRPRS